MKYVLLKSSAFEKSAKKILKRNPELIKDVADTLVLLTENPFDPKLRTHKLKGILEGCWSCSAGFDLRVIFEFIQTTDEATGEVKNFILLETIGTHDEVY